MLPLSLLRAAENKDILVELKNGDTFHGKLVNCDHFMNINLKDITLTSSDGERFWTLQECYIRGNTIKYFRVDQQALDTVEEIEAMARKKALSSRGGGRGRGGRGSGGNSGRGRGGSSRGGSSRGGSSRGRGGNNRGGNRGGGNRGRGSSRGRGKADE